MMKIFFQWFISAVAIGVAAYIVPGVVMTPMGAFIGAVVLGALNLTVRPIIFIITLPLNVITLGLFSLVINALLVWLVTFIVPGFSIPDFWTALLFALVLAIVNWVFHVWKKTL